MSDECLDDLDEGRLYLRGICVAITAEAGMSSETFELNGLNSANFSSNVSGQNPPKNPTYLFYPFHSRYFMQDQNDACDSFYFGYHRKFWTGSERQRAKHKKDLFWMSGLIVAMAIPVAIGVFIVFHLTCLRNVGAAQVDNHFFTTERVNGASFVHRKSNLVARLGFLDKKNGLQEAFFYPAFQHC